IVTELGGPTSHTAIIAAQLNLPCLVRVSGSMQLADDATVAIDAASGVVTLDPDDEMREAIVARAKARAALKTATGGKGRTQDGHAVQLLANVGAVEDAERAAKEDVEGVGLFRTEVLFLDSATAPTVADQLKAYTKVFEAFGERKVVIRTLDAGADKPLAFAPSEEEENPALGVRGYRMDRRFPQLLDDQLEAIAQAAKATGATVWVMAPMVSTVHEAKAFTDKVRAHGLPVAGMMVEVPAAALRARHMMELVDFASIGTNDLTQYAMATDRMAGELAELLDPWQPAVLDLIAATGAAGKAAVCFFAASTARFSLSIAFRSCSRRLRSSCARRSVSSTACFCACSSASRLASSAARCACSVACFCAASWAMSWDSMRACSSRCAVYCE
ncbi:MAG TPA: putative PEP-binding protein, partial [Reyranella sp.]|nr:putative PEP-binding protein [Reyranella sp.]